MGTGGKAVGVWSSPLSSNYCRRQENMYLYIHSPVRLYGVVLNYLNTRRNLPLRFEYKPYSFIHQWLYSPLLGPDLFFSFVIFFTQTIGLLGRVISPSQGRYRHTWQQKHKINAHTHIHALSGIRTYDPSVRASEDSSYLRPRGHCDRHKSLIT
jgi:hypothetical protein